MRHTRDAVRSVAAVVAGVAAAAAVATGAGLGQGSTPRAAPLHSPLDYVVPAGWHTARLSVGGRARTFLLADGQPNGHRRPLLLLFHGLGQTSPQFVRNTAILAAATRAGVVVAAPVSPDDAWNDGRMGPRGRDDDAFALAIVDRLSALGIVDDQRVTVAGFSNGAGMAMELAARHPDRVAALVSVDGELLAGRGRSRPSGRIPAYFVHGTDDSVQPLGGRGSRGGLLVGQISEQQTIAAFRQADGDGRDQPSVSLVPRSARAHVGPIEIYRWGPATGAAVTYVKINGMGHKWPTLPCSGPPGRAPADLPALPAAGSTCTAGSGPGTRSADLDANGLIVGVAASAHVLDPMA